LIDSFHSISFPSEWGVAEKFARGVAIDSLAFPFNLFPQQVGSYTPGQLGYYTWGFHSICFPSKWGAEIGADEALNKGFL
jgi:hypothetical protein